MKTFIRLSSLLVLVAIALDGSAVSHGAPEEISDPDERFLRDLKIPTDDAALIAYLRERSNADENLCNIPRLIAQLGDKNFDVRQKAEAQLKKLGLPALPALREALRNPDKEVVRRSVSCIDDIAKQPNWSAPLAAARFLTCRNKVEVAETLLRFLPYVGADQATEENIWFGLDALAERGPEVRTLLATALKDRLPARRAVAGCILGRLGDAEQKAGVKNLLADSQTTVRLRAAQGLLAGKDKGAIPVLIALLHLAPVYEAWQAEELLCWVAGDDSPELHINVGNDRLRQQTKQAWENWWHNHKATLDLTKLDQDHRRPGLILILGGGGMWLYGCHGQPRWGMKNAVGVVDFQLLPEGSILVAESQHDGKKWLGHVRERDLEGKVVWERESPQRRLLHCQRLPNGATFIATDYSLVEVTWNGSDIYAHDLAQVSESIASARRLPGPTVLCTASRDGTVFELDCATARELRKLPWKPDRNGDCWIQPIAKDHFLLASSRWNEIREMDGAGKIVWRVSLPGAWWARPLAGDTLLAGIRVNETNQLVEIGRDKRLLWKLAPPESIHLARPCCDLVRLGFRQPRPVGVDLQSVSYLTKLLHNKDVTVRRATVVSLTELGLKTEEAIPSLTEALIDADETVRETALQGLESIGIRALPSISTLITKDPASLRDRLATMLGTRNFRGDKKVVPLLMQLLRDKHSMVRSSAAESLRWFSGESNTVLPDLIRATFDDHSIVRRSAFASLGFFPNNATDVVPVLIKASADRDKDVAADAIAALGRIGSPAKQAVPILVELIKGKDDALCRPAIVALGGIGRSAKAAVPALIEGLQDRKHEPNWILMTNSLGQIGPDAAPAIPTLIKLLGTKDSTLRRQSVKTIGLIGPAAKEAVPHLIRALQDKTDVEVQVAAAEALGRIGPAASAAEEALREACKGSGELADAAARSLSRVVPK